MNKFYLSDLKIDIISDEIKLIGIKFDEYNPTREYEKSGWLGYLFDKPIDDYNFKILEIEDKKKNKIKLPLSGCFKNGLIQCIARIAIKHGLYKIISISSQKKIKAERNIFLTVNEDILEFKKFYEDNSYNKNTIYNNKFSIVVLEYSNIFVETKYFRKL
jgi:hypothetical protein